MSKVADLRMEAARLGGAPLKPKSTEAGTSCAFLFRDGTLAKSLVDWATTAGHQASIKSTYRAWLVTIIA